MVDLSIIYSKTGKGLRARNAADAGLSTKQLKLLSFVDGKSKAEEILTQSNEFNKKELAGALKLLEMGGFIRPLATQSKDDWVLTSNFTPMVVEEFKTVEEIEAETRAKAEQEKQEAERIAEEKSKEKIRWKAEINARKEAETKEKARLAQERIVREALVARKKQEGQQRRDSEARTKAEEETKLKAQAEAERKAQEEADRLASVAAKENARREIDRINREAAQAQKEADEKAKIEAQEQKQKRFEIERLAQEAAKEAEIAKKKVEVEAQLKVEEARLETERLEKAQQEQLEAERLAKAENEAKLEAGRKAKAELKAQEATELERIKLAEKEQAEAEAKETARLEMAHVVRKAEEKRKQAEATAKEERQEAKRKTKTEEQARIKEVRKAKDDAEQARVDAEAAEKSKIALQQAAQLEMEHFTHEAEKAEIIAEETKKNSEALRLAEAEQARLQATRIEAEQTQAQAELQAQVQRQIEVEQKQKEATEQELATQQAQEKAEHIRAKNEAEEKASLDAKELARQEMARIAREADALRSQTDHTNLPKPTKNGRFEASRTAKLKKASLESQKNLASQKKEVEKKAQKFVTTQARKIGNQTYIDETQALSPGKHQEGSSETPTSKSTSIDLNSIFLNSAKWFVKAVKTTLTYGFILAFLLVGALHFINISPLIAPIEKLATKDFGKPISINGVHASLWPQPHLMLSDISIGDTLKATSMQVMPDTGTLFEDVKRVKSLTIEGLVIDESNVAESLALINNIGKAQSLKVEQLNISDLRFKVKDLVLGPFDGNLVLNEASELNSVNLNSVDHHLSARIMPQGMDYAVTITGANWPLPLNPNIVFNELKANASIHQNQITFNQIDGVMFGGNISGNALLDWSSGWLTTGNFTLTNANAPQLLKAFASKTIVEGKVNVTGKFACESTEAAKLTATPTITANIVLKNGKINGVDLAHSVMFNQNASLAGEATSFDKLTTNLQVKDGQYHYKQIMLDTKQFHAIGNMDIAQNQAISGRVNAVLVAQSRHLQARFGLAGTLSDVKRQ